LFLCKRKLLVPRLVCARRKSVWHLSLNIAVSLASCQVMSFVLPFLTFLEGCKMNDVPS
jgi:hypothetical protein